MGIGRHAERTNRSLERDMSGVIIMRPMNVLDAQLESSTVPEADAPLWDTGATYALGAQAMLTATHAVYESAAAGNQGNNPATSPDKWTRVRATNRWRCLDRSNSARTAQASNINYVFAPGIAVAHVSAIGLVNCNSLRVRLIDPTYGTVFDKTVYPGPLPVMPDPWEWAWGEWTNGKTMAHFADLPAYPNAKLHIDLVGGPDLAVGNLMHGQPQSFGEGVTYGARLGRAMYSKLEVNKYGDMDLLQRPTARRPSFDVVLRESELDAVMDFLDTIDAQVCLFVLSNRWESATLVGVLQQSDIRLDSYGYHTLNMELLGVT
jgi:hypothetical protein